MRNALAFLEQRSSVKVSSHMLEVYQNAVKLLCMVCTARKNQFYIPGETNLSERLRKRAFDSGTYTLLTYLFNQLKDAQDNPFKAIREHIQQHIMNFETMTDLVYHAKLLTYLKENPQPPDTSEGENGDNVCATGMSSEEMKDQPAVATLEATLKESGVDYNHQPTVI